MAGHQGLRNSSTRTPSSTSTSRAIEEQQLTTTATRRQNTPSSSNSNTSLSRNCTTTSSTPQLQQSQRNISQNRRHFYQQQQREFNSTRDNYFSRSNQVHSNNSQSQQNDNSEDDDEDSENDDDFEYTSNMLQNVNRSNNVLLNNNAIVDESANGEMRPNKLFPVKNERDILLRKVRSVLNKVSSVNYHRLRKRWSNLLPSGTNDENSSSCIGVHQIGEVLQLVIAKALDDTIYMHIYAGLMGYCVSRKPPEFAKTIRQMINSQLHHELQRLTTDKELALFHRSTQAVDATRRKKVTLHRFIAELYAEKACTSKFLYQRVTDLLIVNNPVDIDENVECLCVLMTFAGQKLEEAKSSWVEDIFAKLSQRQTEQPQMVSKRIQFMILDLVEMRSNGWSPHNKWWSPSVQRAPERERTQSSPSMSLNSTRIINNLQQRQQTLQPLQQHPQRRTMEEPPKKLVKKEEQQTNSGSTIVNSSLRARTKSEGSGSRSNNSATLSLASPVPLTLGGFTLEPPQQQNNATLTSGVTTTPASKPVNGRGGRELSANQSRSLMALLNKVSPNNVDRIAHQLYEVLTQDTVDEAVNFIVDKILDDSYYTRTHASLISKVAFKPNMKSFGLKVGNRVMRMLEKSPESKDGFQLLAELYNLNLVSVGEIRQALEWLMNCSSGVLNQAMESLVMLLFISGAKLDSDINDEKWMNRLIEFWEKKANLVAHNQGRPLCLLRDVIELRQNKWAPLHKPHWIPPTIDLPTIRFEPESLIRLFQSDRMEFLRFVKGETSTLSRIERFSKEALEYAVRHGNCERDPEFLKMTGVCLRVLIQERLLRRPRLENFLGTFVSKVVNIRRFNSKAWDNWGLIMKEVY